MKFAIPLLAFFLAACSEGSSAPGTEVGIQDSSGVSIAYSIPAESTARCAVSSEPSVSIGEEEGEEPYLLYQITGAQTLSDGRIAVLNRGSYEVRMFDESGEWIHSFGQQGEAPGEFSSPSGLWIDEGDVVRVGNARPFRFELFDPNGTHIESISIPDAGSFSSLYGISSDGSILMADMGSPDFENLDFSPSYADVVLYDRGGSRVDSITTVRGASYGMLNRDVPVLLNILFEGYPSVHGNADQFVVGSPDKAEVAIYNFNESNSPIQRLRWAPPRDRTVESDDVQAEYDRHRAAMTEESNQQFLNQLVHPERPVAERFPAFSRARLGRDLRVWISRFKRPRDEADNQWMVFAGDGLFECHVEFPSGFTPYELGSNYVLGRMRQENGVEKIQKYDLENAVALY